MNTARVCRHCGADLPPEHSGRGKQKLFCDDNCRVKFGYRQRLGITTNRERLERMLKAPYRKHEFSEPEKAWLAAMIDAEGSIIMIRQERTKNGFMRWYCAPSLAVITNTNVRLIARAKAVLQNRYVRVQTRVLRPPNKQIYVVFVERVAIADVLEALLPYLIAKHQQAKILIEFCRAHDVLAVRTPPLDRFEAMWLEMKSLNKRGVA